MTTPNPLAAPQPPPTLAQLAEKAPGFSVSSIFGQFPAIGTQSLANGDVCAVPYHNYGADSVIIWGTADAAWVGKAIKGAYKPLLGEDGRAQVSVWCVECE